MPVLKTTARPFRLQLHPDLPELRVRSFSGEEAVSKLFRFRLLVDTDSYIPIAQLLGQSATFILKPRSNQERTFLAIISAVDELGRDEHDRIVYGLELVPRLWAMTQTVRSQVFEGLAPLSIIDRMFARKGIRVDAHTRPDDRVRPYCVQYFESDFDFVVRLLEEEGYTFLCETNQNRPAFSIRSFPSPVPRLSPIPFHEVTGGSEERISTWKRSRILTATTVSARDHHFQAPTPLLDGTASVPTSAPPIPGWESLDASWSASIDRYPGQWAHLFEEISATRAVTESNGYKDFGSKRVWHDLRQVAGSTSASEGTSNCPRLAPGRVFELVGHPASAGEYFVISVHHKGSQALEHSTGTAPEFAYENQFTCIPYAETMIYLPPRTTRKPVIHGCQTAVVVGGESGAEIWTDKYGRVRVQFWWDTGTVRSCWIRVATSWAGSNWGIQHIPRVGQEVVVTFLDGDPDRPLIVGSVYNPTHMPPFDLPENSTQSGIRTNSSPKESPGGSNEICFEDATGKEEIYIHAQKDRTAVVENDSCENVGNDRYDVVQQNFHTTIKGEKREQTNGNSFVKVGKNCMNEIGDTLGISAKNEIHLTAAKIVIEADSISIRTRAEGHEFIHLGKNEGITIDSKGEQVWVNCGGKGSPDKGSYAEPKPPHDPFKET